MTENDRQQAPPEALQKLLEEGGLPFRRFMEIALYDERDGYYARPRERIGQHGDFVTAPNLSPAFAFALGRLASEFVARSGDGLTAIVDIGCGDGTLIRSVRENTRDEVRDRATFIGVDRMVKPDAGEVMLTRSVEEIPAEIPVLILSNELFDAFPVARLVQREEGLHELWVKMTRDGLDWSERDAEPVHAEYLDRRGVRLENGQYVDITPEWGGFYAGLCERFPRAMIATIDYGFPQKRLFDTRVRRYGTVAAFHRHQFNRDVLARPGRQDLTAHVNFDDLIAAGEARQFTTLVFGRQAPFLLSLGITAHELFTPSPELQYTQLDEAIASSAERQAARRLVLPEGIGEEMRVLVQGRGIPLEGWPFQKKMF